MQRKNEGMLRTRTQPRGKSVPEVYAEEADSRGGPTMNTRTETDSMGPIQGLVR